MRRLLVVVALLLAGCGAVEEREVDVVLRIGSVRSGEFGVKAADSEIAAVVASKVPTGVARLSLQSLDVASRSYSVDVGQEIRVPVGRYSVRGSYTPEDRVMSLQGNAVCREPLYGIPQQEVVISEDVSEYVLDAEWWCWALVLDRAVVSGYGVRTSVMQDWRDLAYASGEDVDVLFIGTAGTWDGSSAVHLKASPADEESFEAKEYRLVNRESSSAAGAMMMREGYWYVLGPTAVVFQSGAMGVVYPEWRKGE